MWSTTTIVSLLLTGILAAKEDPKLSDPDFVLQLAFLAIAYSCGLFFWLVYNREADANKKGRATLKSGIIYSPNPRACLLQRNNENYRRTLFSTIF